MSSQSIKVNKTIKDLSDFEPVSEDGLYNVRSGIDKMLEEFQTAVEKIRSDNHIEIPVPYTLDTTICRWTGVCSDQLDADGRIYDTGYEISVEYMVDCDDSKMEECWNCEKEIDMLAGESELVQELERKYKCNACVYIFHDHDLLEECNE